jgi:hypothetical protein
MSGTVPNVKVYAEVYANDSLFFEEVSTSGEKAFDGWIDVTGLNFTRIRIRLYATIFLSWCAKSIDGYITVDTVIADGDPFLSLYQTEIPEKQSFQLYNNPFKEFLIIRLQSNNNGIVNIYNINGSKIYAINVRKNHLLKWYGVDIKGNKVPPGKYILNYYQKDNKSHSQVITFLK